MESAEAECVVIGAGVVGLAIARALARRGRETVILERDRLIGGGVSSRNSEVVHAGLYYPRGSLKAALCLRGREALYAYCAAHAVPLKPCGKFVVATSEDQASSLAAIRATAHANGAVEVDWASPAAVREAEPQVRCTAALWSPRTAIVDSHALMLSLLGDAESHGAVIAYGAELRGATLRPDGFELACGDGDGFRLRCRRLVNAAGLQAQDVARGIRNLPPQCVPERLLAKGVYFALSGENPFRHLVYPVPEPGGLGVHVTLDMAGATRFGPDVEWVTGLDYSVDDSRAQAFYGAVRRFWPGLPDDTLVPAYAGIRPKLSGPGQPVADFRIDGPREHGLPGLVNLFGIESPGLTAALAIGEHVADELLERAPA